MEYYNNLPDWLQELWVKDSTLAKKAEEYLNKLNADIRNKLSPIKNLCKMLENSPYMYNDDVKIHKLIEKEINKVKEIINYLKVIK